MSRTFSFFWGKSDIFHTMKYREYLYTARRHLATCQKFFDSLNGADSLQKENLLKDIYYLSGYIFEAFVVYKIYKTGYEHVRDVYKEKGEKFDPEAHDIDEFIEEFTKFTKVDYFPRTEIKDKKGKIIDIKLKRRYTKMKYGKELTDSQKDFLREQTGLCAIEQHHFTDLFKVIESNKNLRDKMFGEDVPLYFVDVSGEVEGLIMGWKSALRYSDSSTWKNVENYLDESSLKGLLNVCQEINEKINQRP